MNYYVRNTEFGRRFMAAWIHARCGFKDQYALWHTTLRLAAEAKCLPYHDEIYTILYRDIRLGFNATTTEYPHLAVDCANRIKRCPDFNFCDDRPNPFSHGHAKPTDFFVHQSIAAKHNASFKVGNGAIFTVQDRWNDNGDRIITELGLNTSIIAKYSSQCSGLLLR